MMKVRMMSAIGLVLAGMGSSGVCRPAMAQQKRPIALDDFAKIVSIASPAISHDGTRIAAVIFHVNMQRDRHDTQLVLINVKTGVRQPLTFNRLGVADGTSIAHATPDPPDEKALAKKTTRLRWATTASLPPRHRSRSTSGS